EVSGIGAARTFNPLDCSGLMTSAQLEPSAQAPWTSATLAVVLNPRMLIRISVVRAGGAGIAHGQRGELFQTSMDIDLDESCGLAGRARGVCDARPLQLYEADDAGLSRLQPPEQVVQCNSTQRRLPPIIDRYFVVERHGCEARGVSNVVDPLVACD